MGVLINLWVLFFEADHQFGSDNSFDIQGEIIIFLLLLGPWILLILFRVRKFNLTGILIAAVLMLAIEALAYYTTFIALDSSTSALIYAVKPAYQILLIIPVSLLVGKAIQFWINKS